MTNKKLWIKILSVVMVVCMLSIGLFACKKDTNKPTDNNTPADNETEAYDAVSPLVEGAIKSLATGDMDKLVVSADLELEAKKGTTTKKYSIYFDLILALYQKNNSDTVALGTELSGEIKDESGNVVLGIYYFDESTDEDTAAAAYQGGHFYVQYKDDAAQKKLDIKVPQVNSTIKLQDANIDFSGVKLDEIDISSVSTILGVIAGITTADASKPNEFSINLAEVLGPDGLGSMLESIDLNGAEMPLGIALKGDEIGDLLPEISIAVKYSLDSNKALKDVNLGVKIANKDMLVNTVDEDGKNAQPLLVVGMDGALELNASLKYAVGENADVGNTYNNGDYEEYVLTKALNAEFSVDITLGQDIEMNLAEVSGSMVSISLPADKYTLSIKVNADPTVILEKVKSLRFVDDNNVFSLAETIKAIKEILNCFDAAEIRLDGKATGNHILVYMGMDQYDSLTLNLVNLDIVSGLSIPPLKNIAIGDAVDSIASLFDTSDSTTSGEDAAADSTSSVDVMKEVAKYLRKAYIGLFADKYDGTLAAEYKKPGVYAMADIDNIPFSGYTEFKGAYNSAYTYYEVDTPATETTDATYKKATVTAETFADGTYYVAGKDVDATNPYGIGLYASLSVTKDAGVAVNATVNGLDFIGLPATLEVTIDNVKFDVFNYTVESYEAMTARLTSD